MVTERDLLIGILNAIGVVYYRITGKCMEIPIETPNGDVLISCGRRVYLAEHPEEAASLPPVQSLANPRKNFEG
jgi:hypothetical protein